MAVYAEKDLDGTEDEQLLAHIERVKAYFDENNVTYCNMSNVNAQEKVEILNQEAEKMYEKGNKRNFITYANGTVLTPGSDVKGEHMASFKYGYRIETVRDWLFDQSKYLNE